MAGQVYKTFGTSDIITSSPNPEMISEAMWSGDVGTLTSFYTSSAQVAASGDYYINIYDNAASASIQFSLSYGNYLGSGSVGDSYAGTVKMNDTPSKAIYSQFKNILLDPSDEKFTFGAAAKSSNECYFISIARSRFKEKLDPGNWQLSILDSGSRIANLIDDSGETLYPNYANGKQVYKVVSGSIADGQYTTSTQDDWGLVYPELGIIVLDAMKLRAWGAGIANPVSPNTDYYMNISGFSLFMSGSRNGTFQARTEEKVNSTHYVCRINNDEFNYTNNPTFVTGSNGVLKYNDMTYDPKVYITTVGLYNDANDLLAVAKLSQPLLKTFSRDLLIRCKLDF